jgi:hypothetical protein
MQTAGGRKCTVAPGTVYRDAEQRRAVLAVRQVLL